MQTVRLLNWRAGWLNFVQSNLRQIKNDLDAASQGKGDHHE